MMNEQQQDEFWQLYEARARIVIERACVRASRSLSDGTMDVFDMVAWIDDRVWRMLRHEQSPTFHDDPAPDFAVDRIVTNARTLARWAYLALSRRHWRQMERTQDIVAALSRTERLAGVRAVQVNAERREEIEAKLAKVRAVVSSNVRRRAAASWQDMSERHRVAIALGVTEQEDQELMDQTMNGEIRTNTVEQMRSRSLRRMREVLAQAASSAKTLMIVGAAMLALGVSSRAWAGEQSGGRGGGGSHTLVVCNSGEQTGGGRGG